MTKADTPKIILEDFWPYQAVKLADQISRHTLSVVRAEAGLNLSQWRVLAAVAEEPGRTAAEVTVITPMDKTIVSRAVSSLITSGLITKISDTTDKRRSALSATSTGQKIYSKVATRLNAALVESGNEPHSSEEFTQMLKTFSTKMNSLSSS